MSRSKQKGTAWETAVVNWLREQGVTYAERRALAGVNDQGDISGIPGVVIECKSERAMTLASYVDETEVERANNGARVGFAWIKRRGKTSPGAGYVVMTGVQVLQLLKEAGYIPPSTEGMR